VALAACSRGPFADTSRYPLTGTIVGFEPSPARVVVAHDAVSGLMPAMSMPFEVNGTTPGLREGDRIAATLVVAPNRSWLEDVRITAAGSGPGAQPPVASRAVPGIPGVIVPPFELRDQNDRPVTMQRFAGRVLVVTFIYTRCPLPDFCPLMVRNLEAIRRRADEEGIGSRLALLGVTLDPAFDTPAVLRAYGESVLKSADRFDRWTLATGTPAQVDEVAQFFGVTARAEGGLVTHTLSTAVVGHDGRIMRLFPSNSWRPDELYDVVRRGVERSAPAFAKAPADQRQ
jgi:protein SCO1